MKFNKPKLESTRLSIRLVNRSDAPVIYELHADKQAMAYWSCPPYEQLAQAEKQVEAALNDYSSGSSIMLGLYLKQSGVLIGTLSLFSIHEESRRAEIGYMLSRAYWGQGLMTEALEAFLHWCFRDLNLHRLEADIDPNNTASGNLLKRCGFVLEGLLRERWIVAGKVTDSELFGLLSDDYEKCISL